MLIDISSINKDFSILLLLLLLLLLLYLLLLLLIAITITVRLLEPGHLEEDYPITTVFENGSFSSSFAKGPIKFKVKLCNHWKL